MLVIVLNLLGSVYQGWHRPLSKAGYNKKELVNEILIQINTYFLLTYSDFFPDRKVRYSIGYTNVGCLGLVVLFNLVYIGQAQVRDIIRWFKLRKLR